MDLSQNHNNQNFADQAKQMTAALFDRSMPEAQSVADRFDSDAVSSVVAEAGADYARVVQALTMGMASGKADTVVIKSLFDLLVMLGWEIGRSDQQRSGVRFTASDQDGCWTVIDEDEYAVVCILQDNETMTAKAQAKLLLTKLNGVVSD